MLVELQPPRIQLPKGWHGCAKSAVLLEIALSHYAIVTARAWAADSINARVQLAAENDRLHAECALLREELRLKDIRMTQIAPQRRPHYGSHERMAILELRAGRGWSLKQTADTFLVTAACRGIDPKQQLVLLKHPFSSPGMIGWSTLRQRPFRSSYTEK